MTETDSFETLARILENSDAPERLVGVPSEYQDLGLGGAGIHAFRKKAGDDTKAPSLYQGYVLSEFVRFPEVGGLNMHDVVLSLRSLNVSFGFLVRGRDHRVRVYLILMAASDALPDLPAKAKATLDCVEATLQSKFPSLELKRCADVEGSNPMAELTSSKSYGLMTGIPTTKQGQISEVIAALANEEWWYLVVARPIKARRVKETQQKLDDEFTRYREFAETTVTDAPSSETRVVIDPRAVEILSQLEVERKRIALGLSEGMWRVCCYLGSSSELGLAKLRSKLSSTFLGNDSKPEKVRIVDVAGDQIAQVKGFIDHVELAGVKASHSKGILSTPSVSTSLTSSELATLVGLPTEEAPGFDIYMVPKFSVNVPGDGTEKGIVLGEILDRGRPTGTHLVVRTKDLVKHGLVVGQPGYGKSLSVHNMLIQLQDHGIPWLVIEPVKGEYRRLKEKVPGLRLFTLGYENRLTRFRMNPFDVPPGVRAQSHIDMLLQIFNMAFSMYTSLPHILEACTVRIYKEKGWDLSKDTGGEKEPPTLADLYTAVERLDLPFSSDTSTEHRGALLFRIGSLMRGSKGKMLNCRRSIPIGELMRKPTILELKDLRDDDQKSLVMGIVFGMVAEYVEANFGITDSLKHFTVLEEAHRILSNVRTDITSEFSGHPKATVVRILSDMLAEVRAHGEGILVVNQIPTEIAARAVKNTSLKLMFHTEHEEDRESMGKTMNLGDAQRKHLAHLHQREAICLAEGFHGPVFIRTPELVYAGTPDEEAFSHTMNEFHESYRDLIDSPIRPFTGCEYCEETCEHRLDVEPLLRDKSVMTELADASGLDSRLDTILARATKKLGYGGSQINPKKLCLLVQFLNKCEYYDSDREILITKIVGLFKSQVVTEERGEAEAVDGRQEEVSIHEQ